MASALVKYGELMSQRIRSCLSSSGFGSTDWSVQIGPPGNIAGHIVWPQIESVEYNTTFKGLTSINGVVFFLIPSQAKADATSNLMYRLMDSDGFAYHWQQPPYPDGFRHLVSDRFVIEPPIERGGVEYAVAGLRFHGMF